MQSTNNQYMTSTNTTPQETLTRRYPQRQAGREGQQRRQESSAYYNALDSTLQQNMGNSHDKYTQSGTVRLEYLGF
jgi:hypothetical protein